MLLRTRSLLSLGFSGISGALPQAFFAQGRNFGAIWVNHALGEAEGRIVLAQRVKLFDFVGVQVFGDLHQRL